MKKALKFSCGDDLHAWLEAKAQLTGLSVSSVIRMELYKIKQAEEMEEAVT